jgi:hypothetical protein
MVGLLALGETLPGGWRQQLTRLSSWALIMAGVLCLAGGAGGMDWLLRWALLALVPGEGSRAWKYIPRSLAMPLRRLAKGTAEEGPGRGELPLHSAAKQVAV